MTLQLENYGVQSLNFDEMQEINGGDGWCDFAYNLGVAAHEAWNGAKKALSDAGDAFNDGLKKGLTTPQK